MSGSLRRRHRLDDPGHRILLAERALAIRNVLRDEGAWPLAERRVLDIGCGAGDSLATLLAAGGPAAAFGVDRDAARLATAQDRVRPGGFAAADAGLLPFRGGTFDLCLLSTVLSSVLDDPDRRSIASEALRVLRSGGAVLWYDFRWNPTNPETRGLSRDDVGILFPGCAFRFVRMTPPAPLARALARRTPHARAWLDRLPLPRTHELGWIRKP